MTTANHIFFCTNLFLKPSSPITPPFKSWPVPGINVRTISTPTLPPFPALQTSSSTPYSSNQGRSLESMYGSRKLALILGVFSILTQVVMLGVNQVFAIMFNDPSYLRTCAAGFSGGKMRNLSIFLGIKMSGL